jgi:branched-chain amino acid transport system substrate-binding protein
MIALVGVVGSVVGACADDGSVGGDASAETASTAQGAATDNGFALAYTLGAEGPADDTMDPITIGWVNQGAGTSPAPATEGAEMAVEYINEELGGVGGHPIRLKTCVVQTEEDGQRCGTEMANDSEVQVVLTGGLLVGSTSLYPVLEGRKPVIIGNPLVPADFLASDAYAYAPGSPGIISGIGVFIATHLENVEKVAVLHTDIAAAKLAAEQLLAPVLTRAGITDIGIVPAAATASAPDVASALQAAGAQDADVLALLVAEPLCIAAYDALRSLGAEPTVVGGVLCADTAMTRHLADIGEQGAAPNGWYFASPGYDLRIRDDEGQIDTFTSAIERYSPDADRDAYTFAGFNEIMTVTKLMNMVGSDQLSAEALREQIRTYDGEVMGVAGTMDCGGNATFPALCGTQMGVHRYGGGEWESVADAYNDRAISPYATP